ncbi:MAG: WYL domain-containing protein [Lachnospiraceae bacterium]|nr:WYL domain-containing protein [Lachnospiraceae bacterium]
MAKGENQKLKLLYLARFFLEQTDEAHPAAMPDILRYLSECGVSAERKSIYSDVEALRSFGLDIIGEQRDRNFYYYIGERQFELAELKLLVDSVQASRFITAKKSNELIRKIEGLTSREEAKQLQRQVYVSQRVKTMNESIYYNVDKLHTAIAADVRIRFVYFRWTAEKKEELRHGGKIYEISPWALTWAEDNYYLIGFEKPEEKIKYFRVDKMLRIEVTQEKREGRELFGQFDTAVYMRRLFGMYSGEETRVRLEFVNELAGVVIDRFGRDIALQKKDDGHFTIVVEVAVSRQFLGWVMSLGAGARILGPESVVAQMRGEIERMRQQYEL